MSTQPVAHLRHQGMWQASQACEPHEAQANLRWSCFGDGVHDMARFSDKAGDLSAFEWRGLGLEPLNCVNSGMQLSDQIYPADPVRRLGDQPAECLGMAASHRFQPSRRRTFAATSLTASTGLQPTGRALPPLVPTGLAPDQHWQRACFGTEHPLAQLPNLPPKLLQAAEHLESLGGGIVSWRKEQMKRIRHLAESLQPVQAQWQQGLHPQVRRIIGKGSGICRFSTSLQKKLARRICFSIWIAVPGCAVWAVQHTHL